MGQENFSASCVYVKDPPQGQAMIVLFVGDVFVVAVAVAVDEYK